MNAQVTKLKPDAAEPVSGLALLREPFAAHHISKLPKESKAQREQREKDRAQGVSCKVCGGWHHKNAVHLDYVGHAALTDRLLDVDPLWAWEPAGSSPEGLPLFDKTGGLWIKLTVMGVTRLGYGAADGKAGGDAVKEIIGDALRNAAMRFGAALDLWHKGDLHIDEPEAPPISAEQRAINHLDACAIDASMFKEAWLKNKDAWKNVLVDEAYARVVAVMKSHSAKFTAQIALPPPPPPPAATQSNTFDIGDDEIPL
jgi:hypothetical protein